MAGKAPAKYKYKTLLVEFDKGVAILTLNRPAKRNAMNPALGDEIPMRWNACAMTTGAMCW